MGHQILILIGCLLTAIPVRPQIVSGDDFDDNARDPAKWGTVDYPIGNGALSERNQRLEYQVLSPDMEAGDESTRPWMPQRPTNAEDWAVTLDVANTTTPPTLNRVSSFGIEVFHAGDLGDYVYAEIYASTLGIPSLRRGFKAGLAVNDTDLIQNSALGDSGDLHATQGAVRLVYNATTKVFTAFYRLEGVAWRSFASFGVAGGNGSTTNANWSMPEGAEFQLALYGFSEGMVISGGTLYGDNFSFQTAAPEPPKLVIVKVENQVQLQWPQSAFNYQLESTETLHPDSWTPVEAAPENQAGILTLRLPASRSEQFFRLRK